MNVFEQEICNITCRALNAFDRSKKWDSSMLELYIEKPPSSEMGDYAFPCYNFAKIYKKSPVKIADELVKILKNLVNSNNRIK